MFVTLSQNNSDGYFINDEDNGVCEYIIIEADNYNEFKNKLNKIASKVDNFYNYCDCCGKRWSIDEEYIEFDNEPLIYNKSVYAMKKELFMEKCFIHFKNENIKKVDFK